MIQIVQRWAGVGVSVALLVGCGAGSRFEARLQQMKTHWMGLFSGIGSGKGQFGTHSSPQPGTTASGSVDPKLESERARQAKANAEILSEMLKVVLMQEPKDRSLFGNYVDSLNQGASLEGVYNGFSHSSYYRELEIQVKGATPQALDFFVSEMLIFQKDEKTPQSLSDDAGEPLPTPLNPAESTGIEPTVRFGASKSTPAPTPVGFTTNDLRSRFEKASIFTLKRALADEALKVISEKKETLEGLANWYSKQIPRWVDTQVDFGLPQRSDRSEKFHHDWAMTSGQDRISWEVLNRLHRILNAKYQAKK